MTTSEPTPLIYFVLGEPSGDALGADLYDSLKGVQPDIRIEGLAGSQLTERGVASLFDISEIAVMGIGAVVARLPAIVRRVYQTVDDIVARRPDVVVLIDSPDFTHAVAKRVRKKLPDVPIVNYVCPSVWAWRPQRAKAMRAYVDHVLAILPFEPETLMRLDGPPSTYVGHPMTDRRDLSRSASDTTDADPPVLLLLPGSRGTEVKLLLDMFGDALRMLDERGVAVQAVLPAVPHHREHIEERVAQWSIKPTIVGSDENEFWFPRARAAIIASGTVSLELAINRVPHVSAYRFDAITTRFLHLIQSWSGNLPNLITDRIIIPEEVQYMARADRLARYAEMLLGDTPLRQHQLDGFDDVIERMNTERPSGELAADVVLEFCRQRG